MPRLSLTLAAAATAVVLAGCSLIPSMSGTSPTAQSTTALAAITADSVLAGNEDATTVNTDEWSIADATAITLAGSTATSSSQAVTVDNGTVRITAAGVYALTGSLAGQVVVDAPDDALVVLILDDVAIASESSAAISVLSADDVGVHLAEGSTNTLSDTSTYAEDADVNAALFSEADLTISGTGALIVTGNANDAITSEDDLVVLGGTLTVNAVDDGLRGKDSLTVETGTIAVTAGGDGFKSDNEDEATRGYVNLRGGTTTISAGDDAIDATTDIVLTDGDLTVSESVEGIEAAQLVIAGGTVSVTASDDALNATTGSGESMQADAGAVLVITGGTVVLNAEGDGLDSNGAALISGGDVTVYGPTRSGNGALDTNGSLQVTGGTLVAFDSGGMSQSPDAGSTQGWITAAASGAAAGTVQVIDGSGAALAEVTSAKDFGSVTFSSPEITTGSTYSVVTASGTTSVTAGEAAQGGGVGGGPGGRGRR